MLVKLFTQFKVRHRLIHIAAMLQFSTGGSTFDLYNPFELDTLLPIGSLIFSLAMLGLVLNRNSVMLYMVGLEMLMLGCGFNYVIFSLYLNQIEGLVVSLVILGIAASETAIGLGIIIACYGRNYSLNMLDFEKSGGF